MGITLTPNKTELVKTHIGTLSKKVVQELAYIAKFELSWSGRLTSFKMLILPQILYLFRILATPLPSKHIQALNTLLNEFVWQGKRARCPHALLVKHRRAGEMGLKDIRDYYLAVCLDQLKLWFSPLNLIPWTANKHTLSHSLDLRTLLIADLW